MFSGLYALILPVILAISSSITLITAKQHFTVIKSMIKMLFCAFTAYNLKFLLNVYKIQLRRHITFFLFLNARQKSPTIRFIKANAQKQRALVYNNVTSSQAKHQARPNYNIHSKCQITRPHIKLSFSFLWYCIQGQPLL